MAYKDKKNAVKYNNQFNANKYDRINLTVPKGRKEIIQAAADNTGESVNGLLNRLIDAELKRLGMGQQPAAVDQRKGGGVIPILPGGADDPQG